MFGRKDRIVTFCLQYEISVVGLATCDLENMTLCFICEIIGIL